MAQWVGIYLPVQGTRVRSLAGEDSHMPQSNWARVSQLLSLRSGARALQQEKPRQWEACAPLAATRESPRTERGPNTAKNKNK